MIEPQKKRRNRPGSQPDLGFRIPASAPLISKRDVALVEEALSNGWVSSRGPYVNRFEDGFRRYVGTREGVATTNGTSALHLALLALGIGRGHEVIVPDFTMIACADSVLYTGARPVLADVDPGTWNIDPVEVRKRITRRTRAIMIVHLYGRPAQMDDLVDIARQHGLAIIEDAAEAHGAEYHGKLVGTFGDASCFSFYSNKIITTGEGGMLVTNDSELAERARALRDLGFRSAARDYRHTRVGFNYRMTNMQAALGLSQLRRIDEFVEHRRSCAKIYTEHLTGCEQLLLPGEDPLTKNVYWMYTVRILGGLTERKYVQRCMAAEGIDTRVGFWPLHKQRFLRMRDTDGHWFPVSSVLGEETLSLPSGNGIAESMVHETGHTLARILAK